jgi:Peptidase M60, enhancin and enhancin-like
MTTFEKAKIYINTKNKNYTIDDEQDYNQLFTKLVMFYQLKSVYGWDVFKKLHQEFRKKPYNYEDYDTNQKKIDAFILNICIVTQNNLLPFFSAWELEASGDIINKISQMNLPKPISDPLLSFY